MSALLAAAPRVPMLDADAALEVAAALAEAFREGAAERDRERALPHAEVAGLKASGLLGIAVAAEEGGPDLPPSVVSEVFRMLATGDPNIAQIAHSHFVYVNFTRCRATPAQRQRVFGRVLDGALLANAQAERGGPTARHVATALRPDADGALRVHGRKFYCTGSLFADVIPVVAVLDDPAGLTGLASGEHVAFLDAGAEGVHVLDDWDGLGQRVTGSGSVVLDGAQVVPELVVPRDVFGLPNGYGAYAQLLHAAIDVGIARAALEDAAAFVTLRSRPWCEAGVEHAVEDPLTVQRFGELAVEVAAAEAMLDRAGRAVDAVVRDPSEAAATRASVDVAAAKVLGERSSLAAGSGLFEVAGTRSAGRGDALDRHWRNARTHTLHDPLRWKLQHLGRHALTGEAPPRSGTS